MSGFKVYKLTAGSVALNDIGETLIGPVGTIVDLTHVEPTDIYHSIDLVQAVNAGSIQVVDARDDFNAENVIITNNANGNVTDTAAGTSGFTVSVTQQGTAGLPEISQVTPTIAAVLSGGEYFTFDDGTTSYYVWFTLDGAGADPTPGGTGIQVDLASGDTQATVAQKIKDALSVAGSLTTTNVPALLTAAESLEAIDNANDSHFGISGGRFGTLDDPNTGIVDGDVVRYDATSGEFIACTPAAFGPIVGAQGKDGVDTTYVYTNTTVLHDAQDETFYDGTNNTGTFVGGDGAGPTSYTVNDVITLSDGSQVTVDAVDGVTGDVTQFTVTSSGATGVTGGVPLTQTSVIPVGGLGFTLTPQANNISTGTIQWDVDDVFLRNSVSDSYTGTGTLNFATGTTLAVDASASITIAAGVTAATIDTPAGGFVNNNDLINKGYVDALVQGIDWKESVRRATTADLAGTYVDQDAGGPDGVGDTITFDSTAATGVTVDGWEYTGNPATGLDVGDRVLVKDQTNAFENGIYVVTTGSTPTATILTRALDQDGSPGSEVSGGNTTFVETGPTHEKTIWSVIWDGQIDFSNPDPLNWSQTGATTDVLAGEGLNSTGTQFNLDISTLAKTATTIDLDQASFAFDDSAASDPTTDTYKITLRNILNDRDIPYGITSNGLIRRTGNDTYEQIAINEATSPGPLDGIDVTNGGIGDTGNIVIGLDIQNLPARSTAVDNNDRVAVWRSDGTNANEYYTIAEIAGAAGASDSYTDWDRSGFGTGPSIGPGSSADTIEWIGGDGIYLTFTSGTPDTIEVEFRRNGLADTAIDGANDTFPFFDANGAVNHEPEYRNFNDAFDDLGVPFGLSGTGIVVKDADSPDSYTLRSIAVEGAGNEAGLSIDDGDGVSANPTLGLDIINQNAMGDNLDTDDEFIVWHADDDANERITGQEVADGVATILKISSLEFATFQGVTTPGDDQTLLSYEDTTRIGSPRLSVECHTFSYSDNNLGDNSWVSIGDAVDSDSGYIMPFKGRIVGAAVHCENVGGGNTFALDVVVGAPAAPGSATQIFSGLSGTNANDSDPDLDITFAAGDKLRIQADRTAGSGSMQDTVIYLMVKWEA